MHWLVTAQLGATPACLWIYTGAMLAAILPTSVWAHRDLRRVHGARVGAKPLKFIASTALFAASTACLMALSGVATQAQREFDRIGTLVVVTAGFEVGYITLQAVRGAPSHYNERDAFHAAMFRSMGLAAVALMASQAWLAWVVWQHIADAPATALPAVVVVACALTFVMGTASGVLLGGRQPPPGVGLPLLGWHRRLDLRPAHFVGVHAQQAVPVLGWASLRWFGIRSCDVFLVATSLYVLVWLALLVAGLARSPRDASSTKISRV